MTPVQFTLGGAHHRHVITAGGLIVALLSTVPTNAAPMNGQVEEFEAASPIDGHRLQGEIDRPLGPILAVVVMYPGSGTHTRDVPSSAKGAPRSFVFRDLSEQLLDAGFATVRYDERGIGCRAGAKPDDIGRCFDDEDAKHITWATLHSDALAIYRQAEAASGGQCIIALGHSEGVIHIGGLIKHGEAHPAGVIAISGPFGSIDGALRYQKVDLVPRAVLAADSDHNGAVTTKELNVAIAHSALSRFGSLNRIAWPKDWSWPLEGMSRATVMTLHKAYAADYGALATDIRNHKDDEPYAVQVASGGSSVVASYGWEKRFFRSGPPLVQLFSGYPGRIAAFYGGVDGNIDVQVEASALRAGFPAARLTIDLNPAVGHSLGDNASFGPMRKDRQDAIVEAVRQIATACRR